jgi:hypothetical protein
VSQNANKIVQYLYMAATNVQAFSGDVKIASNLEVSNINFTGTFNQNGEPFAGSPWTTTGDNLTYTTGNVAIGTTSTARKLTVDDSIRLTDGTVIIDMSTSPGTVFSQQAKIQASDAQQTDYFGYSAQISGDGNTAIVGALNEDTVATNAGAAYIFTRSGSTWSQQAKIQSGDVELSDNFGTSVSISGDGNTVIVGAPLEDTGATSAGAAYIFIRSGTSWTQQAKIQSSDVQQADYFGQSVSISGDGNTVIVSAHLEDTVATSAGAAYIFTRSGFTWSEQAKIQASDAQQGDTFGLAVSISEDGNTAIVGALYEDTGAINAGAAYIFTRSGTTWSEQDKIQASDPEEEDTFGRFISISGDGNTAIVGAWQEDTGGFDAGAAYIFTRSGSTWSQQAKIQSSDIQTGDKFGGGVSISRDGNTAIVGAYFEDTGATSAGAAYIFTRSGSTWSQQSKIQPSDAQQSDFFGWSVSLSSDGNTAFVSAYGKDITGIFDAGAAYIFQKETDKLVVSGDIVANGTILSFTGQHRCFPEGPIERGLIVSANRNKYMNLNGPLTTGIGAIQSTESLPIVSLSNVVNDTRVFGVIDKPELITLERRQKYGNILVRNDKEYGDVRVIINSLGEGAMWIVNTNGNVVSGDYITSSNISGYGQKQDDDILHSYTVAKITMDCDFNPKEIPVQVIKKDENNINILDEYGRLQWEDTDKTQKAYNIKYLTTNGEVTDEANAIWTAAYVGCTYHCG